MHIFLYIVAFLPFIFCEPVSTFKHCFTGFAPKPVSPVITVTDTRILTQCATQIITYTPVQTITPSPGTVTNTLTFCETITTTLPQVTDTFSLTSTSVVTDTEISTAVATSTVLITATTTLPAGTITISTSSGFIPIASNVPTITPTKKRSVLLPRRGQLAPMGQLKPRKQDTSPNKHSLEDNPEDGGQNVTLTYESGKVHHKPTQFPKAVSCDEKIVIFNTSTTTQTAQTTQTFKASQSTLTSTTTVLCTTTVTRAPVNASTTQTFTTASHATTTLRSTFTVTTTSTSTISVSLPSATDYPNCAPNNLLSSVNGLPVGQIVSSNTMQQIDGVPTAYDCCVACVNTADCGFAAFVASSTGSCFLVTDVPYCIPYSQLASFYTGGNGGFTISDGNCGVGVYAGVGPP